MKKLSFSLPTSKFKPPLHKSKLTTVGSSNQQFITEFNPSESKPPPKRPIRDDPDDDLLKTSRKPKIFIPEPSASDANDLTTFEKVELDSNNANDSTMSYGLNIRSRTNNGDASSNGVSSNGGPVSEEREPRKYVAAESVILNKLKNDLRDLPEDNGMDEFEDMPVEEFGAALLSKMGWKEGMGVGKNAKEDVKVLEPKRLSGRGGLGFREHEKELMKMKREKENSVSKDRRTKEEDRKEVKVRVKETARPGSREEGTRVRNSSSESKRGEKSREREGKGRERSELSWLRNHIKVRVISKEIKRGRLYLKKGRIVDVAGPSICDISMDEDMELIQGVSQEVLETAIPRRGGNVLVLYGKNKGTYGSLVEKDTEKETAIVQDADTHDMVNVRLEQIAEYVGDPSDLGY